jgi:hypothetical protein
MVHMFQNGMPMILGDQVTQKYSAIDLYFLFISFPLDGFRKDNSNHWLPCLSLFYFENQWTAFNRRSVVRFVQLDFGNRKILSIFPRGSIPW